jgi:hypothetical protein
MLGKVGDSLIPIWFTIWMLATLLCLVWGFFIFYRYRRLAWGCFAIALLQVILALLPLIGSASPK